MWETYEPPEKREPQSGRQPPPRPAPQRRSVADEFRPAIRAGGQSRGVGAAIAIVAAVVSVAIGIGVASSVETSSESDYSDWYDCIAEESAGDPGLLSPADLCEIGHERPPDYVDDYECDPFEDSGYGNSYGY